MEEFAELMMLGVRVREVDRLAEASVYVPDRSLLLIDATLTADERESVSAHFLERVLSESAA